MITLAKAKKHLRYDPSTGYFWWRIAKRGRRLDAPAGCNTRGYIGVTLEGKMYLAHRLAWFFQTEKWPTEQIDHSNTARSDNRWKNLREATCAQNRANMRRPKHNTSGLKGAFWHEPRKKWLAQISVNNRSVYLGLFDTPKAAHSAYIKAAKKHFGEYARAS